MNFGLFMMPVHYPGKALQQSIKEGHEHRHPGR